MRRISLGRKQAGLLALVIVLIATNIAFAAWLVTRNITMTGGVETVGDIKVYNQDGTQEVSAFNFALFTGGTSATQNIFFRIKNTGNTPALVEWKISSSPITWTVDTEYSKDYYRHIVGTDTKYTLKINKQPPLNGIWAPQDATDPSAAEQITLAVGEYAILALELYYNGAVNIAETFSLTVSFYAQNT